MEDGRWLRDSKPKAVGLYWLSLWDSRSKTWSGPMPARLAADGWFSFEGRSYFGGDIDGRPVKWWSEPIEPPDPNPADEPRPVLELIWHDSPGRAHGGR